MVLALYIWGERGLTMLPLREVRELAAFWQSLSLTCSQLGAAAQLTVTQASGISLSGCIQHLCFVTSCAAVQCLPFHFINPQTCLFFSGFLGAYFFWERYFSFQVRSVLGIPESCWGGEKGEPSRQWRAGEEQQVILVIQCEELGDILPPSTGFMRERGSSSSHLLLSKNTKPLNSTVQQCWELCGRGCLTVRLCCLALPGRLSLGQSPAAWLRGQLPCRGRWHSEGLCLQTAVQIPRVFLQGWEQIHLWEVILRFFSLYIS